jgi:hypothetical protein
LRDRLGSLAAALSSEAKPGTQCEALAAARRELRAFSKRDLSASGDAVELVLDLVASALAIPESP